MQRTVTNGEMKGERFQSRGADSPPELATKALAAVTGEKKAICRCVGDGPGGREDVAVQVKFGGETRCVRLDTGARFVWVDQGWFEGHSGVWVADSSRAVTADGKDMAVCGKGKLILSSGDSLFWKQCGWLLVCRPSFCSGANFGNGTAFSWIWGQ